MCVCVCVCVCVCLDQCSDRSSGAVCEWICDEHAHEIPQQSHWKLCE